MLAAGLFAVILAWPAPEAQAVKLAGELGAGTLIIHHPDGAAPQRPGALKILAEIPAEAAAVEAARRNGYDGAAVAAVGARAQFTAFLQAQAGFVRVVYLKPEQLDWDVRPAQAVLRHGQWPGLKPAGGGEEAGATERPWLVGNLHLYAYLRALYPARTPVLHFVPEEQAARNEGVEVALAEAFAGGGEVVVELPEIYRTGLQKGDARASRSWKSLCELSGFLSSQARLPRAGGAARTAIVAGPLDEETEEFLNLAYRNNLSPEVLPAGRVRTEAAGLRIVAAVNRALSAQDARQLELFARSGGAVLTSPPMGEALKPWWGAGKKLRSEGPRDVYQVGKGIVYAYREGFVDPSQFASDLREASGVDNPAGYGLNGLDFRLWNAATVLGVLHRAAGGRTLILVSYGRRVDHDFLVGVRGRVTSGTFTGPGKPPALLHLMPWDWRVEWNQDGLSRVGIFTLKELGQ
jgi:hypothetical protein